MRNLMIVAMIAIPIGLMHIASCAENPGGPQSVPRITIEQLKTQLDSPNLLIIDVRSAPDWNQSETKIKGAVREDPHKIGAWIGKYAKDRTIVTYCA